MLAGPQSDLVAVSVNRQRRERQHLPLAALLHAPLVLDEVAAEVVHVKALHNDDDGCPVAVAAGADGVLKPLKRRRPRRLAEHVLRLVRVINDDGSVEAVPHAVGTVNLASAVTEDLSVERGAVQLSEGRGLYRVVARAGEPDLGKETAVLRRGHDLQYLPGVGRYQRVRLRQVDELAGGVPCEAVCYEVDDHEQRLAVARRHVDDQARCPALDDILQRLADALVVVVDDEARIARHAEEMPCEVQQAPSAVPAGYPDIGVSLRVIHFPASSTVQRPARPSALQARAPAATRWHRWPPHVRHIPSRALWSSGRR